MTNNDTPEFHAYRQGFEDGIASANANIKRKGTRVIQCRGKFNSGGGNPTVECFECGARFTICETTNEGLIYPNYCPNCGREIVGTLI